MVKQARHPSPGNCLALDSAGDLHIVGFTRSADFPVTDNSSLAGGLDVFITKRKSDGSAILQSSLLGGGDDECGGGIALDARENVLFTGFDSPNFAVTPDAVQTSFQGGLQDGFLTKLSADRSQLLYSTYLGGSERRDVLLGLRVIRSRWRRYRQL